MTKHEKYNQKTQQIESVVKTFLNGDMMFEEYIPNTSYIKSRVTKQYKWDRDSETKKCSTTQEKFDSKTGKLKSRYWKDGYGHKSHAEYDPKTGELKSKS
jgi:hypothetical protein